MTGNTEIWQTTPAPDWLIYWADRERRYFVVDGGSGANLIARLYRRDQRVHRVFAPRHADVLLIFEPISENLAPAVVELYRALPRPRRALIVGEPGPDQFPNGRLVRIEDLLPAPERIERVDHAADIEARVLDLELKSDDITADLKMPRDKFALPAGSDREIATEPALFSLGPVQPFTAGPLRLVLVCDGEQVLFAQADTGYAVRAPGDGFIPHEANTVALDPLAPVASRLAAATALEAAEDWQPNPVLRQQRIAALAVERAQDYLCWTMRFVELLAADALHASALELGCKLFELSSALWDESPLKWTAPFSKAVPAADQDAKERLDRLASEILVLRRSLEGNGLLSYRTKNIGPLTMDQVIAAGVTGPVLRASEHGRADVLGRLLTRLDEATINLRLVARGPGIGTLPAESEPRATASGLRSTHANDSLTVAARYPTARFTAEHVEASVEGPRGEISAVLQPNGSVTWRVPSAAFLRLIPELLAGSKLADAEMIVASLDISMAEVDG